jgi:hypothetical protein
MRVWILPQKHIVTSRCNSLDMYLNDCGVPPPATEGSLEPHPQPPDERARLDLDSANVRHKGPRGTSTALHGEISDPLENAASFWEENQPPLKIRFRRAATAG